MSLGVIGGMGPMATAHFMELIIEMTKADCDKEHLEMIVYNCPTIPDRTSYILGKSEEDPLPKMLEIAQRLREQEVECVAIPCMTAHYFYEELTGEGLKVIHGIRETVEVLKNAGVSRVGIMATDGTVISGIIQKEVEALGMEAVLPDEIYQQKIMNIIYGNVKSGKMPDIDEVLEVKAHFMKERKAQALILGCTELSLIKKAYDLGAGVLDALEVLAKESLLACKKEIRPEFEILFTPYEEKG